MIHTLLCAAFCGVGKSYLCKLNPKKYKEIECWKFRTGDFPTNYIKEVKELIGTVEYLFISSDPIILKQLNKEGIEILLVYPENSLKEEYMKRYCERNSSYDFIGVLYKHWDEWLNALKEQTYCKHIVLKSGEHLQDILFHISDLQSINHK